MIVVENRLPTENAAGGIRLGLVRARGVRSDARPPGFEQGLELAIGRATEADDDRDATARRSSARDMLRNGRYKPTGRGKPASEYLERAASVDFPRINALVDVNNLVSLEEHLPISLWDTVRVPAERFVFRLGRSGETFVFNAAGQTLDLEDLVVGCAADGSDDADSRPVVSPVKDSQAAKTTDGTHSVAACVYAPANLVSESTLSDICARFATWLAACGAEVETATATAGPGEVARL